MEENIEDIQKKMEEDAPIIEEESVSTDDSKKEQGKGITLKSILGGDFLTSDFLRRQVPLLVMIVIFTILYISNRYSSQQELIEIDNLKKELMDIKYDALTLSSELTEKTRQSRIENYISTQESKIETSTNPPYKITKE